MTRRVLCLGMSALDTIYQVPSIPSVPTKILATGYTECGGGMAANASVAVARLSGQASYWGRVGDDALGTRICAELAAEGVDVSQVRRVPDCVSPSAAILVADDGERLVCAYNDPHLDRDASWLRMHDATTFDAVLADVRWPEGAMRVLDAARSAGKPAVLDGDIGPVDVLRDLATRATHAIFSETGLIAATGQHDVVTGLRAIAAHTSAIVGVTLGVQGVRWIEHERLHAAPAPRVQAVDTLGAGDVFHGAFTLALAEGATTTHAMHFANAAAAIKCTRFGGRRGAPSRPEVEALLRAGQDQ
jgi:sulfofructose kinase